MIDDTVVDDGSDPTLWIVTPVFRDVESFLVLRERLTSELADRLPEHVSAARFLVVDDSAGTDADVARLHALEDVRVVVPPFNVGHQRAIVYGLRVLARHLGGDDYVVTLDADGEDRPEDVPRLLERLHAAPIHAVVLAQRTERTESLRFRAMYAAFRLLFRVLTGTSIRTGNFAAQRGHFIINAVFHPSFDLCYSTTLLALRRPVLFVPCARGKRFAGQSRMNTYGLVAHGVRMLLPFAERLAVRMLTFSGFCMGIGAASAVLLTLAVAADASPAFPLAVIPLSALVLALVTFSGFLALFAGFAQSSAIALQGLEFAPPSRRRVTDH
jgi:hypothetical protein